MGAKQVCLVPYQNSQNTLILGRSFSVTRNELGFNPVSKEAWLRFADEDQL